MPQQPEQDTGIFSIDTVDVPQLHEQHPKVRARDWCSPLVFRLIGTREYIEGNRRISVSFRNQDLVNSESALLLRWSGLKADFDQCINTYQEHVLSEYAALGIACILLSKNTDFRITSVCRNGEKVDYWIGNKLEEKLFVLEVSGRQNGSIEALTMEKTQQLASNPWTLPGYICVSIYGTLASRLWFCKFGDE
ncbi:MAG: hypothetical protein HS116_19260 [Planctomycetes bacterium]|nr:hypothetical protein [Planctomycetota bacterium]